MRPVILPHKEASGCSFSVLVSAQIISPLTHIAPLNWTHPPRPGLRGQSPGLRGPQVTRCAQSQPELSESLPGPLTAEEVSKGPAAPVALPRPGFSRGGQQMEATCRTGPKIGAPGGEGMTLRRFGRRGTSAADLSVRWRSQ